MAGEHLKFGTWWAQLVWHISYFYIPYLPAVIREKYGKKLKPINKQRPNDKK